MTLPKPVSKNGRPEGFWDVPTSEGFLGHISRSGRRIGHIDDMPEGDYVLTVRFDKKAPGTLSNYRFKVPPDDSAAEPIHLGTLTLNRQ